MKSLENIWSMNWKKQMAERQEEYSYLNTCHQPKVRSSPLTVLVGEVTETKE